MLCDRCVAGYTILGATSENTPGELKGFYRDLVKQWHPDRHEREASIKVTASQKLSEVNIAYTHISCCRSIGRTARVPSHQNSGFSNACKVRKASKIEAFRNSFCKIAQRFRCKAGKQCSESSWQRYTRCELAAKVSGAARIWSGIACLSFAVVLLCCIFPDALTNISLWAVDCDM